MRIVDKLLSQHLGWTFKKHWATQNKKVPSDFGAAKELRKNGISIQEIRGVSAEKPVQSHKMRMFASKSPLLEDGSLSECNSKPHYIFGDSNVLIGGLPQALRLTKSIEVRSLPKPIDNALDVHISGLMEANIREAIMTSNLFSSDQVKLKKRDALRPTHNLPSDYIISNERKISILISKLLTECEKNACRYISSQRRFVDLMNFKVKVPKHDNVLQFEINAQKMITSSLPLTPIKEKCSSSVPDLNYIKDTVSMTKRLIYSDGAIYQLRKNLNCSHPHTIFIHFDKNKVKNIHDGHVNTSQVHSRNMLKAFSVAAARAMQLYGDAALNNIPRPVVIQSIQTDGRTFHFGLFQLNTLQIDNVEGPTNYWFHKPDEDLYQICEYAYGRPLLEGLNMDVFRYIYAFYRNS